MGTEADTSQYTLVNSPIPTPTMTSRKFAAVALGIWHICGVEAETQRLLCWG